MGTSTSMTTLCQRLTSISNQRSSHPQSGLLGPWTSTTTSCLNPRPRLTSTSQLPTLRSPYPSGTQTETLWLRLPPFLHHPLLPGPGLSSSKGLSCLQGSQAPKHYVLGQPTRGERVLPKETLRDTSPLLVLLPDNLLKARSKRFHAKAAGGSLKAMPKDAQPTG